MSIDIIVTTINEQSLQIILSILGIAVTIFTVVYSFLESNKHKMHSLGMHLQTLTEADPVVQSELLFARKYSERLLSLNKAVLWVIILSLLSLFALLAHTYVAEAMTLAYISAGLTLLTIVVSIVVLIVYLVKYFRFI